jgi:hypothetical protein
MPNVVRNREGWKLYIVTGGVIVEILLSERALKKMHGPKYTKQIIFVFMGQNF